MIKFKVILLSAIVAAIIVAADFGVNQYARKKPVLINGGPALVADVVAPVDLVTMTQAPSTFTSIPAAISVKKQDILAAAPAPILISKPTPTLTSKPTSTPALATQTVVSGSRSTPMTERFSNRKTLENETVAIVCINPISAGRVGSVSYGSGVIINKNGYILTNEHVVADTEFCYMGRPHVVAEYFQARVAAPTIAIYYPLKLIGKGVGVTDPRDATQTSSFHDFAVLKIDPIKMPRSEWQSDQASPEIRTLSTLWIPWATDAEYAQFSSDGTYPAIALNFDYQPVRGDLLSMGGYIADAGIPDYTFADGNVSVFSTTTISAAMPTGQGLSGSPVVDSQGNLVALNFQMDCGEWHGCHTWENQNDPGFSTFTYGNQALSLTLPFLDQGMKQDLGFGLKGLATMN